jgi:hypothetical protein
VDDEDYDEDGDEDGSNEANCISVMIVRLSSALRKRARDDDDQSFFAAATLRRVMSRAVRDGTPCITYKKSTRCMTDSKHAA